MHWRSGIHNEPGRWCKLIEGVNEFHMVAGDLCRMAVIVEGGELRCLCCKEEVNLK